MWVITWVCKLSGIKDTKYSRSLWDNAALTWLLPIVSSPSRTYQLLGVSLDFFTADFLIPFFPELPHSLQYLLLYFCSLVPLCSVLKFHALFDSLSHNLRVKYKNMLFPIPTLLARAGFSMVLVLSLLQTPGPSVLFFLQTLSQGMTSCLFIFAVLLKSLLFKKFLVRGGVWCLLSFPSVLPPSGTSLQLCCSPLLPLTLAMLCVFCQEYSIVISLWKTQAHNQHKQQMPLSHISWFSCSLAASSVVMLYWHVLVVLTELPLLCLL